MMNTNSNTWRLGSGMSPSEVFLFFNSFIIMSPFTKQECYQAYFICKTYFASIEEVTERMGKFGIQY